MFYVHLQVVTFLTSYDIERASTKIYSANEQLRKLKFELEQFKAPHLLEGQVHRYDMNLAIPKSEMSGTPLFVNSILLGLRSR